YIDAKLLSESPAFGKLSEAPHQSDCVAAVPATFFLAQFAEQGLDFFNWLATHSTGVDQHKVRFTKVVDERASYSSKLGLDGMSVVLIHLAAKCYEVSAHVCFLYETVNGES